MLKKASDTLGGSNSAGDNLELGKQFVPPTNCPPPQLECPNVEVDD